MNLPGFASYRKSLKGIDITVTLVLRFSMSLENDHVPREYTTHKDISLKTR